MCRGAPVESLDRVGAPRSGDADFVADWRHSRHIRFIHRVATKNVVHTVDDSIEVRRVVREIVGQRQDDHVVQHKRS